MSLSLLFLDQLYRQCKAKTLETKLENENGSKRFTKKEKCWGQILQELMVGTLKVRSKRAWNNSESLSRDEQAERSLLGGRGGAGDGLKRPVSLGNPTQGRPLTYKDSYAFLP